MKSSTKFWLAIFTFLPIVLFILFFILFFFTFLENIVELDKNNGEFPFEFMQSIFWFIAILIVAGLLSLGIKIYYIVHTNNNSNNDSNKKILWTLILIFTGSIGSVVYYFIEITPIKSIEQ